MGRTTQTPVTMPGAKDAKRATDTNYHDRPFSVAHNATPSPWRQNADKTYSDRRGYGGGSCNDDNFVGDTEGDVNWD